MGRLFLGKDYSIAEISAAPFVWGASLLLPHFRKYDPLIAVKAQGLDCSVEWSEVGACGLKLAYSMMAARSSWMLTHRKALQSASSATMLLQEHTAFVEDYTASLLGFECCAPSLPAVVHA